MNLTIAAKVEGETVEALEPNASTNRVSATATKEALVFPSIKSNKSTKKEMIFAELI
jgi:hypothetical protein